MSNFPLYKELAISEIYGDENFALFLRSDGILQCHMRNTYDFEAKDIQAFLNLIEQISAGIKHPFLAIYDGVFSFSEEALEIFSKHTITLADGLVTLNNIGISITGHNFLNSNEVIRPVKMFVQPSEAILWLKTFIENVK
jgi:hypothetical protein